MSSLQADRTGRPSTSSKAKKDQTRKFNLKPIGAAVIKHASSKLNRRTINWHQLILFQEMKFCFKQSVNTHTSYDHSPGFQLVKTPCPITWSFVKISLRDLIYRAQNKASPWAGSGWLGWPVPVPLIYSFTLQI